MVVDYIPNPSGRSDYDTAGDISFGKYLEMQSLYSQSTFFKMYFWKCFKNVCGSALSFVVASLWHCWWNFLQQIPRNCFHQCKVYVPKVYFSEMYFWKFFFKVYSGLCPCGGTVTLLVTSLISLENPVFWKLPGNTRYYKCNIIMYCSTGKCSKINMICIDQTVC